MEDITKTGVQGLKGLEGVDKTHNEVAGAEQTAPELPYITRKGIEQSFNRTAGHDTEWSTGMDTRFGDSIWDDAMVQGNQSNLNLANERAENQWGIAQIGAGIAKGAVLAGTTFLDGTVGLVVGGLNWATTGEMYGLWNNEFSNTMRQINEESEKIMPNYYTDKELQEPWYENVFTANFLGDKFLKNIGFTVGAFYSGNLASKAFSLTKIPAIIGKLSGSVNASRMALSGVGSLISAVNEGRIEAGNNASEWFDMQKEVITDKFKEAAASIKFPEDSPEYYAELNKLDTEYNATLEELTKDRLKMGNMDMLMNIPILTASNLIQFGKLYANGFKTAKRNASIMRKASGEFAGTTTKAGMYARAALNPFSEGLEEISQKAASVSAGKYYEDDINNFYLGKLDPKAEKQTLDLIKSIASGINETVNDASSWEEFTIGTLTGFMGVPMFGKANNSQSYIGKNKKVGLSGGFIGEVIEARENMKAETDLANRLNARIQDPKFVEYYQGLIRHEKFNDDMKIAAETGDEYAYKNAEYAQMINDVMMFSNAGKTEDLISLINDSLDPSDENIESIIRNTTTEQTTEDGKKVFVGPFVDSTGNKLGLSNQEIADKIKENSEDILDTIKSYNKVRDTLDVQYGDTFNDDEMSELMYLNLASFNLNNRSREMLTKVYKQLSEIRNNIKDDLDFETNPNKKDELEKKFNIINNILTGYSENTAGDALYIKVALNSSKEDRAKLSDIIAESYNSVISHSEIDNFDEFITLLNDGIRAKNDGIEMRTAYNKYLNNPQSLKDKIAKDTETAIAKAEEIREVETINAEDGIVAKISTAPDVFAMQDLIDQEDDDMQERVLNRMVKEGNETAKQLKAFNIYKKNVISKLNNNGALNSQEKAILSTIVKSELDKLKDDKNKYSFIDSMDLSSIQNPKMIQAIKDAIEETNKSFGFANIQSVVYQSPQPSNKPSPANPVDSNTGSSSTPTIPVTPATSAETQITAEPEPIGDGTVLPKDVLSINTEADNLNKIDTPNRGFYRPAIPELHIGGTKEGDFRPFPEVVRDKEGLDFQTIYDYLVAANAFGYVNDGRLTVGDTITFGIDPELENQMSKYDWYKGPTILMFHNNQIVGSLDSGRSMDKFSGMRELSYRISEAYNKPEVSKTEIFKMPNESTTVSQMMIGKVIYGKDRPISEAGATENTVFAVMQNGQLNTNNKVSNREIISPIDVAGKEGRLYMLLPNSKSGKKGAINSHSPVKVVVQHVNDKEFNLNDPKVASTQLGMNILNAIKAMAVASNDDEINKAVGALKEFVFGRDLHISLIDSVRGKALKINRTVRDNTGAIVKEEYEGKMVNKEESRIIFMTSTNQVLNNDGSTTEVVHYKDSSAIIPDIIKVLHEFNLPIQVNSAKLNNPAYNKMLLDSGALISNIVSTKMQSSWFTTNIVDAKGNEIKAEKVQTTGVPSGKQYQENRIDTESKIIIVPIGSSNYEYNIVSGSIIKNGKPITNSKEMMIVEIVYHLNTTYGNNRAGIRLNNNKYINIFDSSDSSDYRSYLLNNLDIAVFDRDTNTFLSANEALAEVNRQRKSMGLEEITKNEKLPSTSALISHNGILYDVDTNNNKVYLKDTSTEVEDNAIYNSVLTTAKLDGIYGDKTDGENLIDNNYIEGDIVFNRNTGEFLNEKDAKEIIAKYNARQANGINSQIITDSLLFDKATEDYTSNDKIQGAIEGVFVTTDGNIVKTNLFEIPTVSTAENPVFLTRVPNYTEATRSADGEGLAKGEKRLANYSYYIVFKNGNSVSMGEYTSPTVKYSEMAKSITESLLKNPARVIKESEKESTLNSILKQTKAIQPKAQETAPIIKNNEVILEPQQVEDANLKAAEELAAKINNANDIKDEFSDEFDDDDFEDYDGGMVAMRLRQVENSKYEIFNKESEMKWLDKVLPQLNAEDRVKFANGLIEVASQGIEAWGMLSDGIITLSDRASKGTTYHEAFHTVFNLLLNDKEKSELLNEARVKYGDKSDIDLEEDMAESFREYVEIRETRGITSKVRNFFKDLYIKVKNWGTNKASMDNYFRMINNGKFAKQEMRTIPKMTTKTNSTFDSLTAEQAHYLSMIGWTEKHFNNVSQKERDQALACI